VWAIARSAVLSFGGAGAAIASVPCVKPQEIVALGDRVLILYAFSPAEAIAHAARST
jgi:hypothetical protein